MKAFPQAQFRGDEPVDTAEHGGLDLLDYFAIHATHEDIAAYAFLLLGEKNKGKDPITAPTDPYEDPEIICKARYMFADTMMEQRTKKDKS